MHEKWNLCLHFSKATTEVSEFSLDDLGATEKNIRTTEMLERGGEGRGGAIKRKL